MEILSIKVEARNEVLSDEIKVQTTVPMEAKTEAESEGPKEYEEKMGILSVEMEAQAEDSMKKRSEVHIEEIKKVEAQTKELKKEESDRIPCGRKMRLKLKN